MKRKIDPQLLHDFHQEMANKHKCIHGFYRYNLNEIEGRFRAGIETPALLMLSSSSMLSRNENKTANFNTHSLNLLLIDFAGKPGDYEKQEAILNDTYYLALDCVSYLEHQRKQRESPLFMLFDTDSVRIEKVGPIFDNMFGWNLIYDIKNPEPLCYDENKWK